MPRYGNLPYIGPPSGYSGRQPKYGITVHCTDNPSSDARDEANYAKTRKDKTSSHYYVDKSEVVQSLDTGYGANHAGSPWPNRHNISYEFCGLARWTRSKWLSSIDWEAAARQMAVDCKAWKIPVKWLSITMLRNHYRGFNTHDDCRRAFGGTTHTDPGRNFPKDHLLSLVKKYMNGDDDDMPTVKDVWTGKGADIIPAPPQAETAGSNKTWTPAAHLTTTTNQVRYVLPDLMKSQNREVLSGQAAILAAVGGADLDGIQERVRAELERAATAERAERLAELEAVKELIRQVASGSLSADEFLDALAGRLIEGQAE